MSKNVKGLKALYDKLSELGGDLAIATVEKSVRKNAKLIQGQAKEFAKPGDTGRLANSINTKVETSLTGVRGIVYTNVEYAAYVEFGTGQSGEASPSPPKSDKDISYREDWIGMDAQPYLYPALKNNEEKVIELIKGDIEKAIERVARK